MFPTTKITRLITAKGETLDSWYSEPEQLVVCDAEATLAEWADVPLDAVEYDGDDFLIHGEPVASLQTTFRRAA